MSNPKKNPLRVELAQQLIDYCLKEGIRVGQKLTERKLAEQFGVSRSPIRGALQLLVEEEVVEYTAGSGYRLKLDEQRLGAISLGAEQTENKVLYRNILKDRFAGRIPKQLSERDLMRRYEVSRGVLLKVLMQMSKEGLIQRGQGHGWLFSEMLDTVEKYQASYVFRLALEPTAILSPKFKVDPSKLERCYEKQVKLLKADLTTLTGTELFDLDAELHEMIVSFSGNPFFVQAIRHQNQLRRIVEYESFYVQERIQESCQEHVEILQALRLGNRELAATLIKKHLQLASQALMAFENTEPVAT